MRSWWLFAVFAVSTVTLGVQRYNQLVIAATRAQSRLLELQSEIDQERRALLKERDERLRERELCRAALPSREAVREAVRQLLSEAVRAAASTSTPLQNILADSANNEASTALLAQAELVRAELREAWAQEEPGWCNCPPLPNFGLICRALVPTSSNNDIAQNEVTL